MNRDKSRNDNNIELSEGKFIYNISRTLTNKNTCYVISCN